MCWRISKLVGSLTFASSSPHLEGHAAIYACAGQSRNFLFDCGLARCLNQGPAAMRSVICVTAWLNLTHPARVMNNLDNWTIWTLATNECNNNLRYLILVGLSSPLLLHCLNLFLFCSFHLLRYRTFPFRCCGRSISSSLHTIPVEVPMRIVADGADGCWWWVHGGLRWTWNACRRGFWKNAPNTLRHTFPSNNLCEASASMFVMCPGCWPRSPMSPKVFWRNGRNWKFEWWEMYASSWRSESHGFCFRCYSANCMVNMWVKHCMKQK